MRRAGVENDESFADEKSSEVDIEDIVPSQVD